MQNLYQKIDEELSCENEKQSKRRKPRLTSGLSFEEKCTLYHKRGFNYAQKAGDAQARYLLSLTDDELLEEMQNGSLGEDGIDEIDRLEFQEWYEDITAKLMKEGYPEANAGRRAEDMLLNLPNSVRVNIDEWLHDEEISDRPVGELSIRRIMDGAEKYNFYIDFARCASCLEEYVKNGCGNSERYVTGAFRGAR